MVSRRMSVVMAQNNSRMRQMSDRMRQSSSRIRQNNERMAYPLVVLFYPLVVMRQMCVIVPQNTLRQKDRPRRLFAGIVGLQFRRVRWKVRLQCLKQKSFGGCPGAGRQVLRGLCDVLRDGKCHRAPLFFVQRSLSLNQSGRAEKRQSVRLCPARLLRRHCPDGLPGCL